MSQNSKASGDPSPDVAVVDRLIKLLVPDISLFEEPHDELVTIEKVVKLSVP